MKFSEFHELEPSDSKTASRVLCEAYPVVHTKYQAYDTDPRPNILVLGRWKNENTKNNLLAGLNLNYMSSDQLKQLRKRMKDIFSKKSLKNRYWRVKRYLPDIAEYYRTYDEKYVHGIERGDFDDYLSGATVGGKDVKDMDKEKAKETDDQRDLERSIDEPEKEPEDQDDALELDRKAWELGRQMHDPRTDKPTSPERSKTVDIQREKQKRRRRQRREKQDLERRAEVQRLAKQLREPPPEDEVEAEWPSQSSVDDVYESTYYSPDIGFVWDSTEDYVRHHSPQEFIAEREGIGSILEASRGRRILAAYDTIGDRLVVDLGNDHNTMLHEAGWGYTQAILFESDGTEVVIKHELCSEDDLNKAISAFRNSVIPALMAEA
jgi:hypothetical protein